MASCRPSRCGEAWARTRCACSGAVGSEGLADAQFPVIPVEPGFFLIFPDKRRFGAEDSEPNQTVAGQFP
jgi:hypothetical protein